MLSRSGELVVGVLCLLAVVNGEIKLEQCQAFLDENVVSKADGKLTIRAAGASFPNELYQDTLFSYDFHQDQATVSYRATGSSKGKCRIKGYCENCNHPFQTDPGTDDIIPADVDFVGSDSLLKSTAYTAYPDIQMIPAVAGAVVPVYNLESVGIKDLVLTPKVLSQIFRKCVNETHPDCVSGSIKRWDDPSIVELNPTLAASLTAAGEIIVVTRADKSGTTEIYRKALSSFDTGFASQVGASSSATWNQVDHVVGEGNGGVLAFVMSKSFSIGYSVLAAAQKKGAHIAQLTRTVGGTAVLPSAVSVSFAVIENGLNFGNNGDDPSRLTADIHNAQGPLAWPIAGYTYFVVRLDTLRRGASCEHRKATLDFLRWFYTDPVVADLAAFHGFASLPGEVSGIVLQKLETELRCNGTAVYVPKAEDQVACFVNRAFSGVATTVFSVFKLIDDSIKFVVTAKDESVLANQMTQTSDDGNLLVPVLKIGFKENVEVQSDIKTLPFISIAISPVFNLCGAVRNNCEYTNTKIHVTLETLAKIYSGQVTLWSDPLIIATDATTGGSVVLPDNKILIARASDELGQEWDKKFQDRLKLVSPNFKFDANFNTSATAALAMAFVQGSPWTLFTGPVTSKPSSLAPLVGIFIDELGESVYASADSIKTNVYPMVETLYISFKTSFNGSNCYLPIEAEGEEPKPMAVPKFARLIYWLLDANSVQTPLENRYMGFATSPNDVDAWRELQLARVAMNCDGQSVMKPFHDNSLTSSTFRVTIRVVTAVLITVLSIGILYVIKRRSMRIIRLFQYELLVQVILGGILGLATLFPLTVDDASTFEENIELVDIIGTLDNACLAVPWLFFMAYALTFTPLLLKAWRVNKLFNNKRMKKLKIPLSKLLKYEAGIMAIIVTILLLWSIQDPPHWERTIESVDTLTGLPTKSIGRCVSETQGTYVIPLVVFILITLVYGNYLSYKGRNVPGAYSEGKWIAFSLLNFLECFILCLPILMITADNPGLDVVVKAMFILICYLGTLCIILIPKIVLLYKGSGDSTHSTTVGKTHPISSCPSSGVEDNQVPSLG